MSAPADAAQKKPRHRHSPSQVAALKEVYEKNDHPPLEDRTQLAQKLGMQIKTVNAWFQNRRASSRKRTQRAEAHSDPSRSISRSPPPLDEDEQSDPHQDHSHTSLSQPLPDQQAPTAAKSDMSRKPQRNRPSPEQLDELRKLFDTTQHPTTEQRQRLAERIGMKYQTITNWFQNQRSVYKNKRAPGNPNASHDPSAPTPAVVAPLDLPPPSTHPSLGLGLTHPRLPSLPISRDASIEPYHLSTLGFKAEDNLSDRASLRAFSDDGHVHDRSDTPLSTTHRSISSSDRLRPSTPSVSSAYRGQSPSFGPQRRVTPSPARAKRTNSSPRNAKTTSSYPRNRPEPSQLDALRKLFLLTQTPSVDQRTRLADEIGMDLAKVTNWFRNSRQTSRRRQAKGLPDPLVTSAESKEGSSTGSAKPRTPYDEDEAMDGSGDDDVEMDDSNSSRGTPMSTEDESDMEQDVHLPPFDVPSRRLPPPLAMTGARDAEVPMIVSPIPVAHPSHMRPRTLGMGLDAQAASGLPMSPAPVLPPLPTPSTPPPYSMQAAYAHERTFELPPPKTDRMSIDQSWSADVSMKDVRNSSVSSAGVRMEDAMLLLDFSTRSVELVAH
ncbi:hypothetical protein BD626DRAFT_501251 [Schizophyllum amplum]|uniref:Homeobox domain-containing protein n=1 Tax=Schizophyllum amplum TaxID=97359 RepID=A0A550C9Y9_9AGAR|nr:hypothetical protein BD626DRAFT_501251 [Auriculariopsis ampla]